MKAYSGSTGTTPLTLPSALDAGEWSYSSRPLYAQIKKTVSIEGRVGGLRNQSEGSEERKKTLVPVRSRRSYHRRLVTIRTESSQLVLSYGRMKRTDVKCYSLNGPSCETHLQLWKSHIRICSNNLLTDHWETPVRTVELCRIKITWRPLRNTRNICDRSSRTDTVFKRHEARIQDGAKSLLMSMR
jgi:hypothetical protein